MNRYLFLLLIIASFFWGTSFASAKIGLRELDPLNLVIIRFLAASLIFGVILLIKGRNSYIKIKDIPVFIILGFMGISTYFYIQFTGLQYTTTVNSAIIIATSPIIIGIIGAMLGIEKLNRIMVCGISIAFIGVTLIISHGNLSGFMESKTIKGDLMLLSNAIVWAGLTLYGKKIMLKYRPIVATAYIQIFGTIPLVPFIFVPSSLAQEPLLNQIMVLSWPTVAAVLYLAVFCSVFAYYLWYTAVDEIGAVRTGVFLYLNPLFATFAGVFLLGETASIFTIFGGCLVIVGVYITNKSKPNNNENTNTRDINQYK